MMVSIRNNKAAIIFSILWLAFCFSFLVMAFFSYQSVNSELPRAKNYEAPEGSNIFYRGVSIPEMMEDIVKTHNIAVEKLEASIKNEAKTMTVINAVSGFLCFVGFVTQICSARNRNK